jgi:hypothetical protein
MRPVHLWLGDRRESAARHGPVDVTRRVASGQVERGRRASSGRDHSARRLILLSVIQNRQTLARDLGFNRSSQIVRVQDLAIIHGSYV